MVMVDVIVGVVMVDIIDTGAAVVIHVEDRWGGSTVQSNTSLSWVVVKEW